LAPALPAAQAPSRATLPVNKTRWHL
jgi:hypothetical protein